MLFAFFIFIVICSLIGMQQAKKITSSAENLEKAGYAPNKYFRSQIFNQVFTPQHYLLTCLFSLLGAFSKAKGVVDSDDIDYANDLLDQMLIQGTSRSHLQQRFNEGKQANFSVENLLSEMSYSLTNSSQLTNNIFNILLQSEPFPSAEQLALLAKIAPYAGVSAEEFNIIITNMTGRPYYNKQSTWQQGAGRQQQHHQYSYGSSQQRQYQGGRGYAGTTQNLSDKIQKAYQTLGLMPDASEADIKKAYRKLIKEFHPDRFAAQDLPKEMQEYANKKCQEINAAYDLIGKARGF
ncbi:co-chaperone DjlA [Brackiella oedipodis]|uniref:co-chaperone DjlA n=1 Tax=Brackiella oedipodis TaxID=124225 RepID=UPI00048B853B|nr:co-chaperone DjlA [Brackiella oedipodis]